MELEVITVEGDYELQQETVEKAFLFFRMVSIYTNALIVRTDLSTVYKHGRRLSVASTIASTRHNW